MEAINRIEDKPAINLPVMKRKNEAKAHALLYEKILSTFFYAMNHVFGKRKA